MTCYVLCSEQMKKLVPRGSGRPPKPAQFSFFFHTLSEGLNIVPYARDFLSIEFFFKYSLDKLCIHLPQNVKWTVEIARMFSTRSSINEARLAHHIVHLSCKHGDMFYKLLIKKIDQQILFDKLP